MCLNTILFDLDGTLLPLEIDYFMKIYFEEMGKVFIDIVHPKELVSNIWKATEDMVKNIEEKTNEEVFMEAFERYMGRDIDIFKERFYSFYDEGFLKVKEAVQDVPMIRESIELLKDKGYEMIIATNPLFPKKAILHRIRWAGFDPKDFKYITCYEESHYCKPQLKFYEEILKNIDKNPEECMMVGNDVQEDLVARELGIKTFLIEDYMIHREDNEVVATYRGKYEDFHQFVHKLEKNSIK